MSLDLHGFTEYLVRNVKLRNEFSSANFEAELRQLARDLSESKKNSALLRPGETACVNIDSPKTAALFFDRVWREHLFKKSLPDAIAAYGGTDFEIYMSMLVFASFAGKLVTRDTTEFFPDARKWFQPDYPEQALASSLYTHRGEVFTPMYASTAARNEQFRTGDVSTIVAAIDGLKVIDEAEMTWDHVIEFRKDAEAKKKLRRLKNWLKTAGDGRSIDEVTDLISAQLEDYEWALTKHGIQTVTGTISELLDPKLLSTSAAVAGGLALTGAGFWAAAGAAGILVGRAAVSLTQKLVDLSDRKRGQGSEVAFVHELKKLSK